VVSGSGLGPSQIVTARVGSDGEDHGQTAPPLTQPTALAVEAAGKPGLTRVARNPTGEPTARHALTSIYY